ncbi:carbohydrate ABC transporter permease [Catellatospora bangladeshensis]|uniref:sn-glycerol-3-phosphate transport system permease protein UgpE n=1 Tax=Catellatospora bangladeshensis TaxID=310355 RepID=A0A8J3NMV1_9ACTN|nr:carbohydrate ABC transporter permease [Catellatospora bangladeshensis]GIF86335.1 sn-glycerol-3-phosphate transport system permease protein UgpE [Catellatospora bangladeshensis]
MPSESRTAGGPRRRIGLRAVVAYLIALLTVAPLLWLVLTVFKPAEEVFRNGLPSRFTLDNIRYVLTEVPFGRYLFNSALVSLVVTGVALILHSMAAYALARLRFPGRTVFFYGIVSTLLVSLPVILVPLFLVVRELGLLDTYAGLILPAIFHAFGIFLLRQYYLNLPRELEEAADLDGCGYFHRWWRIVLPLSRPALASLAVLFFLANWNAFLWPVTATRDPDLRMVQVGISTLQGQYGSAWNHLLAATVIAAVPTVIAFLAGQRRLVEAIKTSGLK